jgi:hypothetical protein
MFSGQPSNAHAAKKDGKNSCFKTLIFELFSNQGDFNKINPKIRNANIRCQVQRTYPQFLVTDGTFFI